MRAGNGNSIMAQLCWLLSTPFSRWRNLGCVMPCGTSVPQPQPSQLRFSPSRAGTISPS